MKSDDELVKALIPHWYATRRWAEELLCRSLGLTDAQEVLRNRPIGVARSIAGSTWTYRTHGIGVDVDRGVCCGGIDFDFDKPDPDPWRLSKFAEKQFNAGTLPPEYRELVDDSERFEEAASRVLGKERV